MTAWANLLLKSTAAAASTAWVHLISPFAGGGVCPPEYDLSVGYLAYVEEGPGFMALAPVAGFLAAATDVGVEIKPAAGFEVLPAEGYVVLFDELGYGLWTPE
jgi:hypothetical protein